MAFLKSIWTKCVNKWRIQWRDGNYKNSKKKYYEEFLIGYKEFFYRISSRLKRAKERVCELEDRSMRITQIGIQKEKKSEKNPGTSKSYETT